MIASDRPVRREQEEAQAAVGQLLHDRRDDGDGDEERGECADAARVPFVGDEPLLVVRVEER